MEAAGSALTEAIAVKIIYENGIKNCTKILKRSQPQITQAEIDVLLHDTAAAIPEAERMIEDGIDKFVNLAFVLALLREMVDTWGIDKVPKFDDVIDRLAELGGMMV